MCNSNDSLHVYCILYDTYCQSSLHEVLRIKKNQYFLVNKMIGTFKASNVILNQNCITCYLHTNWNIVWQCWKDMLMECNNPFYFQENNSETKMGLKKKERDIVWCIVI